jgi:glutamine amidotransferase
MGTFTEDGSPLVEKQPVAAYQDTEFAAEARERCSETFVAHIRYASTGGLQPENTHPFCQQDRLFAHNGIIGDLSTMERELGPYRDLVIGDTDSERFFALITKAIDDHDGDVTAGITSAARWVAANVPVYAINLILTTREELWALRYPETHQLFLLEREAGGPHGDRHLEQASPAGTIRTRSAELDSYPAVVVASERMDESPSWTETRSGELIHIDTRLSVSRSRIIDQPPRRRLELTELSQRAAASQTSK